MSAKLRVIIDERIAKLALPSGIPGTVEELKTVIQETFRLDRDFSLQYMDVEFNGQFFTLLATSDINDKDTVKVVFVDPVPHVTITLQECLSTQMKDVSEICESSGSLQSELASVGSCDTVLVSSSDSSSSLRCCPWPSKFEIPSFSYDTELILAAGNEAFKRDGTLLNNPSVKSDILEKLADSIFEYTAYPTAGQRQQVAEALVEKHPCLREPGSFNGLYGWLNSLKYKMGNFRAKVRAIGCPELDINSLKRKSADERAPAKNVKKPKKAEVNYLPPNPRGETDESLEKDRVELLYEVKKKDNSQIVNEKMTKTFSYRRKDIILQSPPVTALKARWPGLFNPSQIEEEFRRITTIRLLSTFMDKLDHCTPQLLSLFKKKGGAAGVKISQNLERLYENNTIESKRDRVIQGLITYLGEKVEDLIKEYRVVDDDDLPFIKDDLSTLAIKIFVMNKATDSSTTVGIVIDGEDILTGMCSVAEACAFLMGLIYALNLSYPQQLKYTFEVFQKLFLELDVGKTSSKVQALKIKLLA